MKREQSSTPADILVDNLIPNSVELSCSTVVLYRDHEC